MRRALFIAGGWDGHQPEQMASLLASELGKHGFQTEISNSLEILDDANSLNSYDLISPCWTMGSLTAAQSDNLQQAVRSGIALAGVHGGMGDAFRGNGNYEWMVGGHFVGHPHVGDYTVHIKDFASPITHGLPSSFSYHSEQYYMLIDPSIHVLADAEYTYENRSLTMPVAWVKRWGKSRVFYSALGHTPDEFLTTPEALTLAIQGMRWAAGNI